MISKRTPVAVLIIVMGLIVGCGMFWGNGLVIGRKEYQGDRRLTLGIWTRGTTLAQTFIASQDNLCRIDFFVQSYHPWDSPYLDCRLFELDTLDNPSEMTYDFISSHLREVRYKRINGWLISGHMFNSFSFAPIPDSQRKRYLFTIQSPGLKEGGIPVLLASPVERYEYGNLFVNGEKKEGDLSFRALYEQPRLQVIRDSVARVALQKPFLSSFPSASYALIAGYVLLLGLFFWGLLAVNSKE